MCTAAACPSRRNRPSGRPERRGGHTAAFGSALCGGQSVQRAWIGRVVGGVAVEVDLLGVDEREELLVMPLSGVDDHLGDVSRAVDGPLQLLRDLVLGGLAAELAPQEDLGSVVVLGGGDQQLGIA